MDEELLNIEQFISVKLIQEDAESILSLLKTERDSIFCMEIIPYYALFIQSFEEFIDKSLLPDSKAKNIKDIRNHIKAYADRFSKTKREILKIDCEQDEMYKEQLKYQFMKDCEIHYNLGTYWYKEGCIIGNTQQLASFLEADNLFSEDCGAKFTEFGETIGSYIASVCDGIGGTLKAPQISRNEMAITIVNFCDLNTNHNNKFFNKNLSKEYNILFLNLLCNMNFIKHMLQPLFEDKNTWMFRIQYVVTYYTMLALEKAKNQFRLNPNPQINIDIMEQLLDESEGLFQTKFRNCMMHYDLKNAKVISIDNIDKPMFGMIETCFNGMDYYVYLKSLREFSDKLICYLESLFDFTEIELKKL